MELGNRPSELQQKPNEATQKKQQQSCHLD
jgi:hypothetical protein